MVNRPYSTCIDFVLLMKERGGKICAITLHVSKIIINGYSPITLHQTIIILMHFEVDEKRFGAGAFLVNFLDKVFHANIFKNSFQIRKFRKLENSKVFEVSRKF